MNCDIDRTVPACALIARGIVVSSLEKTVLPLTCSKMASASHVLRVALEPNHKHKFNHNGGGCRMWHLLGPTWSTVEGEWTIRDGGADSATCECTTPYRNSRD